MKRFLCTLLMISMLIAFLCIPVFAEYYPGNFTNNLVNPITERFSDSNGQVVFYFEPMFLPQPPFTAVSMDAPSGTVGRVLTMIASSYDEGIEPEAWTASSEVIYNNKMTCSAALQWNSFATKVNFYAARSRNGVVNVWDYYYTAANHVVCSMEDELMTIKNPIE